MPSDAVDGTIVNVGTVVADTPDQDLSNNSDDASVIVVAQIPPSTTLPPVTLPRTGSDVTGGLGSGAFVLILLGAGIMLIARRRQEDSATTG